MQFETVTIHKSVSVKQNHNLLITPIYQARNKKGNCKKKTNKTVEPLFMMALLEITSAMEALEKNDAQHTTQYR